MFRRTGVLVVVAVTAFLAGAFVNPGTDAEAQAMNHVYELRTYTASDGKLDELLARFRGGEIDLFPQARHGERRLLGSAGRAPLREHAGVYRQARQPRGRERLVERIRR